MIIRESTTAQLVLHEHLYDVDVDQLYPHIPLGDQLQRLVEVETRLEHMAPREIMNIKLPSGGDIRWMKNGFMMVQRGGPAYTSAMLGNRYEHELFTFTGFLSAAEVGRQMGTFTNSAYDPKRKLLITIEP